MTSLLSGLRFGIKLTLQYDLGTKIIKKVRVYKLFENFYFIHRGGDGPAQTSNDDVEMKTTLMDDKGQPNEFGFN